MNRLSKRIGIVHLLSVFTLISAPTVAFAHAHLASSSPAKDSVVHSAPTDVTLHFSEELEPSMCKLDVKNFKTGEVVSQGAIATNGEDKSSLKIALKSLGNEKADYEVSWKAVSKDSHKMPGKYKFTFDPKAK